MRLATSQRKEEKKGQGSPQENWAQQAQLHVTPQAVAVSGGKKGPHSLVCFPQSNHIFTENRASHALKRSASPLLSPQVFPSFDKPTLQIGYIYMERRSRY